MGCFLILYIWVIAVTMVLVNVFDWLPGWDGWVVGVGLVLIFLGFVWDHRRLPRYRYRHLKGTGTKGTALALSFPEEEGDQNRVGLASLRVSLPGQEPYLVKQQVWLKSFHRAAFTTQEVPVWVDPKDRNRVFIDWEQVPTNEEMVRQKHEAMLRSERGQKGPNKKDSV